MNENPSRRLFYLQGFDDGAEARTEAIIQELENEFGIFTKVNIKVADLFELIRRVK